MAISTADTVGKKLVDAISVWDQDHIDRYFALMDPSFEIHDPLFPAPLGKEALRKLDEGMLATFPDMTFEVLGVAASGDVVAIEVKAEFTFKDPLHLPQGVIPPTGRRHEYSFAAFYRFNDRGLLTSLRNYGPDFQTVLGAKG